MAEKRKKSESGSVCPVWTYVQENSDSKSPEKSLEQQTEQAVLFASTQLGPASERAVSNPAIQTCVLSNLRAGSDLEDSVLVEMHRLAVEEPQIADEFIAHFLRDLVKISSHLLNPGLRRYMDSGDLVNSVMGGIWKNIQEVEYRSRRQFFGYLVASLRNKSIDHTRKFTAGTRRDEQRVSGPPEEHAHQPLGSSPSMYAIASERRNQMILSLCRLREREQQVVRGYLNGRSKEEIAKELSLPVSRVTVILRIALKQLNQEP